MEKEYLKSKLELIHNEIKNHPFRIGFCDNDIASYKNALYSLSEVWSDLCWKLSDQYSSLEKRLWRQFCSWIHNYRQELRTYRKNYFPMEFFDFYEQILQITHHYILTDDKSEFYTIKYYGNNSERKTKIVRFRLVTEEDLNIKSTYLPLYLPVGYKFDIPSEEDISEYFDEMGRFTICTKWERDKDYFMEDWKTNHEPIMRAWNLLPENNKPYIYKIHILEGLYL